MALDGYGYAQASLDGKHERLLRVVYEMAYGVTLDPALDVDHTCHDPETCVRGSHCPHRACLEPSHFEAVPHAENQRRARRARCHKGHPMDGIRRYWRPRGKPANLGPYCKTCNRERVAARNRSRTGDADHTDHADSVSA